MKRIISFAISIAVLCSGTPALAGALTVPLSSASVNSYFDHTGTRNCFDGCTDSFVRYDGQSWPASQANMTPCTLGQNCYNGHEGIDYQASIGTNVLAAADGTVQTYAYESTGYGTWLRIWHSGPGYSTLYAHLSQINRTSGAVIRGDVVGLSGNTGTGTGAHLHFGVYDAQTGGTAIDPYGWSGSGADPWTADKGYLWTTSPPSLAPPAQPSNLPVPAVGYNQDGRMVVGVRGTDSHVYTVQQTAINGGWDAAWQDLPGTLVGNPAFGHDTDGRVEMFVRDSSQAMRNRWQTAANSGWNGSWDTFGGTVTADAAVASNQDGRVQFFTRGTDQAVYAKYQLTGGGWSGWTGYGGGVSNDMAIEQNADGRLEFFVRGNNGAIYERYQTQANGGWSDWASLDGNVPGKPVVVRDGLGRLRLFVLGADGNVYHKWQSSAGQGFGGWYVVGSGSSSQSNPAVGVYGGQPYVFLRGGDGSIWYTHETATNAWTTWQTLNCNVTSDPAVGYNQNGKLTVFARGTNGVVYYLNQTGTDSWGVWTPLGDAVSRF